MNTTEETKQCVLVVDDDWLNQELMEGILTTFDFDILQAHDGEQGIKLAEKEQPDLILLDVRLPGMDGFTICRELKQKSETKHIPIVMITGQERDERERIRAKNAGADDFISRMMLPNELIERLRAAL